MIRRHLFCLVALFLPLAAQTSSAALNSGPPVSTGEIRSSTLPEVHISQHEAGYSGTISGFLDFPYRQVTEALRSGRNWCEIAPLHFNVKACVYEENGARLTFYSGRKHYQVPEKARPFVFRYEVRVDTPARFEARLVPDTTTRKYGAAPIVLQAQPQPGNRTSIRALFTYQDSWLTRVAAEGYFATMGQGKKGFTITGTDARGRPVYLDGIPGAIERNAARYYFALNAFLGTHHASTEDRFEQRLSRWFDLTDQYRMQLYEMDKDAYLGQKRRERDEQLRLQRRLDVRLSAGEPGQRG